MNRCPDCGLELTQTDLSKQVCSQCSRDLARQVASSHGDSMAPTFYHSPAAEPAEPSEASEASEASKTPDETVNVSGSLEGTAAAIPPISDGLLPTLDGIAPTLDGIAPTLDGETASLNDLTGSGTGIHPTWDGAIPDGASPTMSLKTPSQPSKSKTRPSLLIQQRMLAQSSKLPSSSGVDYEVLRILGQGGMGVVFSARQGSLDREVAVKMLRPQGADDPAMRDSFLSEACVTGELEHPNIVPIYDLGRNADGAFFYAMKQVRGTPWNKAIRNKSLAENVDILMRVCDAMALAHSKGIIHRDLKPENTMLGDFGEVLVMDWGLAIPTDPQRVIGGIELPRSMAGTPSYMAPEMAMGPYEAISTASDVYLLGAILFEIVTGQTAHTGTSSRDCMIAAARNVIQTTDKRGPLLDIALRAMQTKPKDRYGSVREFQAAIREYQEHSESIALAVKAGEQLDRGRADGDYEPLSRAVFGYQEALGLWDGNESASRGLVDARYAYASAAHARGDYDLALGQLDPSIAEHHQLYEEIAAARVDREQRIKRLATYKKVGFALAASLFAVVTGAAVWINSARQEANSQRLIAVEQKDIAVAASEQERIAKENALLATEAERLAKIDAEQKRIAAETAEEEARLAKLDAEQKQAEAERAKMAAEAAREQERLAKLDADEKRLIAERAGEQEKLARQAEAYESYVARIGAAAAKIDENAYDGARELLAQCVPTDGEIDHRNWEWGRLAFLCKQASQTLTAPMALQDVAVQYGDDQTISFIAAAGTDGKIVVWNQRSGDRQVIETGAENIHAIVFSPSGRELLVGTDDPQGFIQVADVKSGLVKSFPASESDQHSDAVLSLEFSPDGRRLLSASRDGKVKVWDFAKRTVGVTLHRHRWWVWQARFVSPTRIVSVSQDATAIVWEDKSATWSDADQVKPLPTFRGHEGPIYAVAVSGDGKMIATAGHDRQVLIWDPADLTQVDLLKTFSGEETESATKAKSLIGHTATIRSLAFAPSGKLLISSGHDNSVRIWNTKTNEPVKTLRGHGRWVMSSLVSRDGDRVVSAGMDETVRIWDIAGYEEQRVLRGKLLDGHSGAILAADFSPESDRIVTASRDRTVRIWNPVSGQSLQSLHEGHTYLASNATVFADGTRLATAAADNSVRVWDMETGAQLKQIVGTGSSAVVAASRDGQWLLTAGPKLTDQKSTQTLTSQETSAQTPNWTAQVWNAKTGELIHKLTGHRSVVSAVAISPDGKLLFTGDIGGSGKLWDARRGTLLKKLDWHQAKVISASFTDDNQYLVTGALERNVARWDLKTGKVQQEKLLIHPATMVSMSTDRSGRYVVTNSDDHRIRVWDIESKRVIREIDTKPAAVNSNHYKYVAISPDASRILAIGHESRSVRAFDIATGKELLFPITAQQSGPLIQSRPQEPIWNAIFAGDSSRVVSIGGDQVRLWDMNPRQLPFRRLVMNFSPHGVVTSASFSSDASEVISGSWDGTANIWDAETGIVRLKLVGKHAAGVGCAVFSPDPESKYVLTTSNDGTAVLWNAKYGAFIRRYSGHNQAVRWGAFDQAAERFLTASDDGTVRVWSVNSNSEPLQTLQLDAPVLRAAFSPDGKRIATGSADNQARLWDFATAKVLHTLSSHTAPVTSVAFTADGNRLLTGSEDFMAKLWDADTGKELLNLSGHEGEVTSVAFSPSRLNALTGSYDGTAIMWMALPWDSRPERGALATQLRRIID